MSDPLLFEIEAEPFVDVEDYEWYKGAKVRTDEMWQEHLDEVGYDYCFGCCTFHQREE